VQLTEAQIERLRQTGVRLDSDGRWWNEGQEVTHDGLRAAFWRWLDRLPDGRFVLRLDERRYAYIQVDDAPFVARSARWEGDRAFLRLSDGGEEELAYDSLRVGEGGVPYVKVRGGRFDARLSTGAWGVVAERLAERAGATVLDAAGGPWPLPGAAGGPEAP
jgi:hypothetical protein